MGQPSPDTLLLWFSIPSFDRTLPGPESGFFLAIGRVTTIAEKVNPPILQRDRTRAVESVGVGSGAWDWVKGFGHAGIFS
jgi:hypothetical protein